MSCIHRGQFNKGGKKNPKRGQFEAQKGAKKGAFRPTTFYSKKINKFIN
jgi:hypothetical protein